MATIWRSMVTLCYEFGLIDYIWGLSVISNIWSKNSITVENGYLSFYCGVSDVYLKVWKFHSLECGPPLKGTPFPRWDTAFCVEQKLFSCAVVKRLQHHSFFTFWARVFYLFKWILFLLDLMFSHLIIYPHSSCLILSLLCSSPLLQLLWFCQCYQ